MRKQLARAGVVAVAAMMLTTTAFAAEITAEDVKYTGINEVTVTVPTVAGAETSLLAVTSVEDATAPTVTDGKNIAYVDQDKTDSSVVALAEDATLEFKFNTQGPADRTSTGSIDVFSAYMGGTDLASVLTVKEMAPAKSIELTVPNAVTIPAGSDSNTIKGLLKAVNATVTVTHQLSDASEVEGTPIAVGSNDDVFTYAIEGEGVKVNFDPETATNAKFNTTAADNAAISSPVVKENVTIKAEPVVVTGIKLSADAGTESSKPVELRNTSGDNWDNNNDLVISRLKEKVEITASYTVADGKSKAPADVTDNANTAYAVTGGTGEAGTPYVITVTYKENSGADGKEVISEELTLYAVKGTPPSTVAISGTVKTRVAVADAFDVPTARAIVSAYDATGKFVGAAITDENGAFTVEVPAAGEYTLAASYTELAISGNMVSTRLFNSANQKATAGAADVAFTLTRTQGDANGDGQVNSADANAVSNNMGKVYTSAAAE